MYRGICKITHNETEAITETQDADHEPRLRRDTYIILGRPVYTWLVEINPGSDLPGLDVGDLLCFLVRHIAGKQSVNSREKKSKTQDQQGLKTS